MAKFWNISQADQGFEIQISGYIGGWDDFGFAEFEAEFRDLWQHGQPVTFRINSLGGDVHESMAIYDLVRLAPVPTFGVVHGVAASAAGWVFQACSWRRMTEHSFVMIHKVQGCGCGTSGELRDTADMSDRLEKKIRQIYYDRSSKSRPTVDSWFKEQGETWLDAAECLKAGLADEIIRPAAAGAAPAYLTNQSKYQNRTEMEFKQQVAQAFGLDTAAKEDTLLAALTRAAADHQNSGARIKTLEDELAAAKAELKRFQDAEAERLKAQVSAAEAAVNAAFQGGALNEAQKAIFLNLARKEPETVLGLVPAAQAPRQRSLGDDLNAALREAAVPQAENLGDKVSQYLAAKYPAQK
jgi:ATP-dependent protease ClpP protease subunit